MLQDGGACYSPYHCVLFCCLRPKGKMGSRSSSLSSHSRSPSRSRSRSGSSSTPSKSRSRSRSMNHSRSVLSGASRSHSASSVSSHSSTSSSSSSGSADSDNLYRDLGSPSRATTSPSPKKKTGWYCIFPISHFSFHVVLYFNIKCCFHMTFSYLYQIKPYWLSEDMCIMRYAHAVLYCH